MGKSSFRLSTALGAGVVFAISLAPASGQQAPTSLQTLSASKQTTLQQTTVPSTQTQQTPSLQLISQQAQRNPARQVGLLTTGQQTGTGTGLTVTLDYLSSLKHDDNLRLTDPSLGSTTWWENTLYLSVLKQTTDSTLSFDLSGLYRIANEPIIGTEHSFSDPFSRLSYQRVRANSRLSLLAQYRERDLAFNRSLTDINLDGIIDAADVIGTVGDQINTRGNLDWETGLNDPLGLRFTYNHNERTYSNTISPSLFDNSSDDYAATVFLRASPVFQNNLRISYTDYTADDAVQTDRQTTTVSTGVTYNVSSITTINANIGYTQVDDTQRVSNISNVTENFVWSFSWNKSLPDGSANILLDQTFGVNGVRTNTTFGRSFQLTNGVFGFNVGFTRGPFDEVTPIGQIDYSYQLASSQIGAKIQRRVGTSTQSIETRQTVVFLTYDYFINPVSALNFSVNFVDQENDGSGPSNPRQRGTFDASYTRAITKDWALNVGYQYEMDDQNGFKATSDSVFLTLGRRFTLKP
ncbi:MULTISPECIES: hypothetical protein [unclassified Ruegeria]|uniref:hypothetical protein n=1 Tax=unclassified Ruegeria TaxID=2625375 RepID=UPI001AE982FA|nr:MULTISPECIES: hypothetical protein [unclassified Ruegeria]